MAILRRPLELLAVRASDPGNKLLGLQLGRAIAALSVVITHAVAHPYPGAPGVFHLLGRYGVTLFFIISGYIMVLTTGPGKLDPGKFMDRRIRRIVPIYYIASLFLAFVTLVAPSVFKNTVFDLKHILLSLFFIPAYQPNGSGFIWPFFRLGWTLNYEMFFYVMFAACCALRARTRAIVLTLLFTGLVVIGVLSPFQAAIPRFYTQVDVLGFIAGVWLGIVALRGPLRLSASMRRWMLIGSMISFGLLAYFYHGIKLNPLTQLWTIATCAVHLVLLIAAIDSRHRPVSPALVLVGDASYSIYLFHMFAIGAVTAVARKLPAFMLFPMMAVSAVAGVAIGLIVYRLVEAPINTRLRRRRAAVTAGAVIDTAPAHTPAA